MTRLLKLAAPVPMMPKVRAMNAMEMAVVVIAKAATNVVAKVVITDIITARGTVVNVVVVGMGASMVANAVIETCWQY